MSSPQGKTCASWISITDHVHQGNMGCMHQLQPHAMINMIYVHEISQVSILMRSEQRCVALARLLTEIVPPDIAIHRGISQEERLSRSSSSDFLKCILVTTNLFGHKMDFEHVNVMFNYDMLKSLG